MAKKPATTRLLCSADWHIQEGAWKSRKAIHGDALYSLGQLVAYAVEHKVDAVLAAGDLYDITDPDAFEVARVNYLMSQLEAAVIPIWFIQGQHERRARHPWLGTGPWPEHAHEQLITIGPITLYGLDWTPPDQLPGALAKIPAGTDILMCHQVWEDHMGVSEHIGNEGRFNDVPNVRFILTGDYHMGADDTEHQLLEFTNNVGTGLAITPGPLAMQSIDETEKKSFVVLTFEGKELTNVESVPLKTRAVFRYQLATENDLTNFLDQEVRKIEAARQDTTVPEHIRIPLAHIAFNRDLPDVYARLQKAMDGVAHFFPKPVGTVEEIERDVVLNDIAADGLLGALRALVPEDREIHHPCRRLLTAPAPAKELELLAAEFFEE